MPEEEYVYTKEETTVNPKKSHKKLMIIPLIVAVLVIAYFLYNNASLFQASTSTAAGNASVSNQTNQNITQIENNASEIKNNFSEIENNVSEITNETVESFESQFAIESAVNAQDVTNAIIRNTGNSSIALEGLTVYIDGEPKNIAIIVGMRSNVTIDPGEIAVISINESNSCNKTLSVKISTGLQQSSIITC